MWHEKCKVDSQRYGGPDQTEGARMKPSPWGRGRRAHWHEVRWLMKVERLKDHARE